LPAISAPRQGLGLVSGGPDGRTSAV
jgi:hypothetical protein